jgi:lipid II:glycine glycyltransferase (peptidoglycan interpeptide bridge formation enzyme)
VCGKEELDNFVRIMQTTGERDGFNTRGKIYFERMLDALGSNVRLYMAFYQDEPISGAISVNYAGKASYLYGASDNKHRNVMPNYLVQWEMIKWAIDEGAVLYDFGGMSGDMDENNPLYGLYRFKKGFSGEMAELAGEFVKTYNPFVKNVIDAALSARKGLLTLKRRLR